jgi:hypothetical protein
LSAVIVAVVIVVVMVMVMMVMIVDGAYAISAVRVAIFPVIGAASAISKVTACEMSEADKVAMSEAAFTDVSEAAFTDVSEAAFTMTTTFEACVIAPGAKAASAGTN